MSRETELQENRGREVQLVNAKADMEQASPHSSTLIQTPPKKCGTLFRLVSAAPDCPRRSKQQQLVATPRSRAKLKPQKEAAQTVPKRRESKKKGHFSEISSSLVTLWCAAKGFVKLARPQGSKHCHV